MTDNFGTSDDFGTGDFGGTPVDFDNLIDSADVDVANLDSNPLVNREGMYHFEIESTKARFEGINDKGEMVSKDIQVVCTVLESVDGQSPAGSVFVYYVPITSKEHIVTAYTKESLLRFLLAVGVCERKEIEDQTQIVDTATGTTRIEISTLEQRLLKRQFLGDVKAEKDNRDPTKTVYRFPFNKGMYQLADSRFAHVPKNWESAKLYGVTKPANVANQPAGSGASPAMRQADKPTPAKQPPASQRRTAPATTKPAAATAPAAKGGDDDYADL